ncbi:hypothetical protein D9M68_576010 [compost metagenome]
MAVHAAGVVGEDRLGHEGRHLAVAARDVLHDVLVDHHVVGHAQQRRVLHVDLVLPGAGHLVVMDFHLHAGIHQFQHDFRTDVLQRVVGRHREVAFLVARLVAEVAAAEGALVRAGIPRALHRVDEVVAAVGVLLEADRVEDEELQLRPEVAGPGDAAVAQEMLGLLRHVARVARVGLAQDRVEHAADQRQRRNLADRIDEGGGRVRLQQHVRLVDFLESADRRAVEADTVLEQLLGQLRQADGKVLPQPRQVGELQVDDLDVMRADELDHLAGVLQRGRLVAAGLDAGDGGFLGGHGLLRRKRKNDGPVHPHAQGHLTTALVNCPY